MRWLGDMELTEEEKALLDKVKALFDSKDKFGEGSEFRKYFIDEIMENYCIYCGNFDKDDACYCRRDD